MSLYVFEIKGAAYVKMGFTTASPWSRVSEGFWSNVHPTACCNKLGWQDLSLLALFEGSRAEERALQEAIPPECGEFWPSSQCEEILQAMRKKLQEKTFACEAS